MALRLRQTSGYFGITLLFIGICISSAFIVLHQVLSSEYLLQVELTAPKHIPGGNSRETWNEGHHGKSTVHVCISSSANSLIGFPTLINSIRNNTRRHIKYHLITDPDTVDYARNWIENSRLLGIDYDVTGFEGSQLDSKIRMRTEMRNDLAGHVNYARYFYSELFPDIKRVIHLDDDVIVHGDLGELYDIGMPNHHIVAASDDCNNLTKHLKHKLRKISDFVNMNDSEVKARVSNPDTCSFNAAILVMDLDKWREEKVTSQLMTWMELNTKRFIYHRGGSQPPLFLALHDKYTSMDPLWNVRHIGFLSKLYPPGLIENQAKALHWNGIYKPWRSFARYSKLWYQYYIPDPKGLYMPASKAKLGR